MLAVPLLVLCGFPVLTSIGISQVVQIVGAISGTAANAHFGTIDFHLASFITIFEICGVIIGAHTIHRVDSGNVKKFVGVLCLIVGTLFMYRSLAPL
ncbi:sulfite exporter TauE/SafE family protein [Noviherbaspirillum sp. Root189]|uniref:TSUP family transporter n=1 Tax=Noviherbaspirillum sp. Root189 TaxID=1736487 RepID=UPI00138EDEFB